MIRGLVRLVMWLLGLALVVLIASKFLFDPAYTVSSAAVVRVPPEKVWAKVGNLDQWPLWVKGIERLEVVAGEGGEVGSRADLRVYNGFQGFAMSVQLVEVIPALRVRYQVIGGPQHGLQSTIALKPGADGKSTQVTWNESHAPGGLWGNLLAAVIKSIATAHHDESLNQLKFKLEREI